MSKRHQSAPEPADLDDYPAGPQKGTKIATLDDLDNTGSKCLTFYEGDSQLQLLLHQTEQGIKGYINSCPHARTPLNLFGDKVTDHSGQYLLCQTHGALFQPENGLCVSGPCKGEYLRSFEICVQDNSVYIA